MMLSVQTGDVTRILFYSSSSCSLFFAASSGRSIGNATIRSMVNWSAVEARNGNNSRQQERFVSELVELTQNSTGDTVSGEIHAQ